MIEVSDDTRKSKPCLWKCGVSTHTLPYTHNPTGCHVANHQVAAVAFNPETSAAPTSRIKCGGALRRFPPPKEVKPRRSPADKSYLNPPLPARCVLRRYLRLLMTLIEIVCTKYTCVPSSKGSCRPIRVCLLLPAFSSGPSVQVIVDISHAKHMDNRSGGNITPSPRKGQKKPNCFPVVFPSLARLGGARHVPRVVMKTERDWGGGGGSKYLVHPTHLPRGWRRRHF